MAVFLYQFWLMVVGHAVADYPLQGDSMAVEKCRHSTTPLQAQVPWYYWLSAHAVIHGGAVTLITQMVGVSLAGSIVLGVAETIVHWFIDFAKCEGKTTIHQDQGLHIACKLVWALLAAYVL